MDKNSVPLTHHQYFSPGLVGSVGDTLVRTRKQRSNAELEVQYLKDKNHGENKGTYVQDGMVPNYAGNSYGGIKVEKWIKPISHKTSGGWRHQDLRAPDKTYEPAMSQTFSVFDNQRATILQAKRTGVNFLPLPHGYEPKTYDVPRGGLVPRVTAIAAGDFGVESSNKVVTQSMLDHRTRESTMMKVR